MGRLDEDGRGRIEIHQSRRVYIQWHSRRSRGNDGIMLHAERIGMMGLYICTTTLPALPNRHLIASPDQCIQIYILLRRVRFKLEPILKLELRTTHIH